ncbi:hypothetical protein RHGRI_001846 [Rhododendron griersonianum]|uniref:Uncharacterized protein n=1 Tax=Rhododendron griersonianum TaxID=479676 RepID=A0AAV6LLL0_9ERIC|nr:hypothetical protein RHGRI_001846 [Rhododendron griersonianum]
MRKERRRVSAVVHVLKRCHLLLPLEDDDDHKLEKVHNVLGDMGISRITIASRDRGALISHGAISDWPKKETYEHYTSISMILKEITKLPVGLKCRDLELLLLECWEL